MADCERYKPLLKRWINGWAFYHDTRVWPPLYECESCGEKAEDSSQIEHGPNCIVADTLAFLADWDKETG